MGQEKFRTRNSRNAGGKDSTNLQLGRQNKSGKEEFVGRAVHVGSKPINRRELPWKIRKLNSLLRLFRRIAKKRDPPLLDCQRWKQKYLWPERGEGEIKKKKKKRKKGGWIEDEEEGRRLPSTSGRRLGDDDVGRRRES